MKRKNVIILMIDGGRFDRTFQSSTFNKFNNSKFYERFRDLVSKLDFTKINLKQSLEDAAETIIPDTKHLDNNSKYVTKEDIVKIIRIN